MKKRFIIISIVILILALIWIMEWVISAIADEVIWDISMQYSKSFTIDIPIPANTTIGQNVSLFASGIVKITSPANVVSSVIISEIDTNGFLHVFDMSETGEYQIEEKYTLVFQTQGILDSIEYFTKTSLWTYTNFKPSIALLFRLDDMYIDSYNSQITPANDLRIGKIVPSPARPGDVGWMEIVTIRDINAGENINFSIVLSGMWHKISLIVPEEDTEVPYISHSPLQFVQGGASISAKITDNLGVDSAILYFRDVSISNFQQIPMVPADEPDKYEGHIPINAKPGNGQYYFEATDVVDNKTTFPATPYDVIIKPGEYEHYIEVGWNLISLPLKPLSTIPEEALNSIRGKYDSVWAYNPVEGWSIYTQGAPSDLEEIVPGNGYWIKMDEAGTLSIQGTIPESTAISLKGGEWNLVGYSCLEGKKAEDCMRQVENDINSVWEYGPHDAVAKDWSIYTPGAPSNLEIMKPGYGYWVKAKQDCIWNVNATPPSTAIVTPNVKTTNRRGTP